MSDRELLELAAKAAGLSWDSYGIRGDGNWWNGSDYFESWDPLDDDGDAFRLAAKLDLSIVTSWGFDGKPSGSVGVMLGSIDDLRLTSVKHDGDPCDAWRRSIVIAAAEIGKRKPC